MFFPVHVLACFQSCDLTALPRDSFLSGINRYHVGMWDRMPVIISFFFAPFLPSTLFFSAIHPLSFEVTWSDYNGLSIPLELIEFRLILITSVDCPFSCSWWFQLLCPCTVPVHSPPLVDGCEMLFHHIVICTQCLAFKSVWISHCLSTQCAVSPTEQPSSSPFSRCESQTLCYHC